MKLMYICDTCGSIIEPTHIIYYHDESRDELYLTCPYCRGDIKPYHEEENNDTV